jgi:hypothetical protein
MTTLSDQDSKRRRVPPGFLLAPLGWAMNRLGEAIDSEPSLLGPLLQLDKRRMHLIAFALAHMDQDVSSDLAFLLLREPHRKVLDLSLGACPTGLNRALGHLPPHVLDAENYRNLADLLNDRATAKFLHHRSSIDEAMIAGLARLPLNLRRPAILAMFDKVEGMGRVVDGLRCLAARARLPFDVLATEIGSLAQTEQVVAKISQLAESLPLLDTWPPPKVGPYRRIDNIAEIRSLAKEWQNCLASCVSNITDGTSAVYRTEPPDHPAVCFVRRQRRLGWFLEQVKGPKNIDLQPQQLAQAYSVFADAGIFQTLMIEAIKNMILTNEWPFRPTHPT